MNTSKAKPATDKVFETSTVRLSADETRLLIRAAVANKPISYGGGWTYTGLVDMGILRPVSLPPSKDYIEKNGAGWRAIEKATAARDLKLVKRVVTDLEGLEYAKEQTMYELTELGKQLARGITVRIAAQH